MLYVPDGLGDARVPICMNCICSSCKETCDLCPQNTDDAFCCKCTCPRDDSSSDE